MLVLATSSNPGRAQWVDASTLSGSGSQIILRPGGVASGNVYTTWATAHAAAAALAENGIVLLILDNDGAVITAPAGTWDMQNIKLTGLVTGTLTVAAGLRAQRLQTAVGCVFTNWWLGVDNTLLEHLGTAAPLFSANVAGVSEAAYSGKFSTLRASGSQVVIAVSGAGSMTYYLEDGTVLDGVAGDAAIEAISSAVTSTVQIVAFGDSGIVEQSLTGAGDFNIQPMGVVLNLDPDQPGVSGAITFFTSVVAYTPGSPGSWVAPAPENMSDAIDRLATNVAALKGSPV